MWSVVKKDSTCHTIHDIQKEKGEGGRGEGEYEGGPCQAPVIVTLALARHQSLSRALSLETVQMFVKFVMIMISNTILQTSNSIHLKTAPALSQNPVYQILHARLPR
jgi:hypothetical protein